MTTRSNFDRQLEALHLDLVQMGGMVQKAIEEGIRALMERDGDLAERVVAGDKAIDDMEQQIERTCLRLLMRQQPVARDFRSVFAALKMITDLERIADQAADIANLSHRFTGQELIGMVGHIPAMERVAREMVESSISAFVRQDLAAAQATIRRDDEMDALFGRVKDELIELLHSGAAGEAADQAIDVLMVAKYMERIGDHAVNVCEWVEYLVTGVHQSEELNEER